MYTSANNNNINNSTAFSNCTMLQITMITTKKSAAVIQHRRQRDTIRLLYTPAPIISIIESLSDYCYRKYDVNSPLINQLFDDHVVFSFRH